jgi:hypothetical protein
MGGKRAGRLRTAALVITTAMSISVSALAVWKLGPEPSCNIQGTQRANTFLRLSAGGSLSREIRKNNDALIRQMPFYGDISLSVTLKIKSSGEVEIENAKASSGGSSRNVTTRVRKLIQIKNLSKFSDSDFTKRETFEFQLHKN